MPKQTITKDELSELIAGIAEKTIGSAVDAKLAQVKDANKPWLEEIESGRGDRAGRTYTAEEKSIGCARIIRALGFAKGDIGRAEHFAKAAFTDDLGKDVQAAFSETAYMKALASGDLTAGGFMVPPDFASGIIELLRSRTIVRKAGAMVVPMNHGSLTLPRQATGASYAYVGENKPITVSQPSGDQIVMTAKKLSGLIPISNDLLSHTTGNSVDRMVRDDIVAGIAVKEDSTFIRSTGTAASPTGLRYQAAAGNITATNGTTSVQIEDDFKDLLNALETNDVVLQNPVWMMNPKQKNHLINLRATNGELVFPEISRAMPMVHGYPVFTTNSIPNNLGGGSNESELYLCEMSEVIIAEQDTLEIAVSTDASYVSGASTISTFQSDQTAIRAIMRHDLAVRHDVSIAVKTGITWG